ncbi:winged helix-turn-helix domain-containing protein [Methylorubrum sp. SB2]|uniref:winged helix-turn-helix domain-containing protein n=1 Tax=Methylorubrum subtropicum TaxID=3138812 RepID=UPI00313D9616
MGLSEAQAEARLAELRRRRDAIEREIADLVLYLDLGRRLAGQGDAADFAEADDAPPPPVPPRPAAEPTRAAFPEPSAAPWAPGPPSPPPAAPRTESEPGGLSETVQARRYGRALIEAALATLEEAGRPLHAGEIWARLVDQGFALPGADPVAALNTRLWKRCGPGGPLRRLGDAVYAPAEAEEG